MVIKLTDSDPGITASDLETKLLAGIEGMDPAVSSLLGNLVNGVFSVADYSSASQTGITKGDLVIMQTVYTVLGNVSDVIFTDGPVDDTTGLPPMNENIADDTEALSGLIDQVNIGIQIIDAVAPASSFGDLQLDDILKDLLSSMNSGSEGGSN